MPGAWSVPRELPPVPALQGAPSDGGQGAGTDGTVTPRSSTRLRASVAGAAAGTPGPTPPGVPTPPGGLAPSAPASRAPAPRRAQRLSTIEAPKTSSEAQETPRGGRLRGSLIHPSSEDESGGFLSGASAKNLRRKVSQIEEEKVEYLSELETLRNGSREQALRLERLEGEVGRVGLALERALEREQEAEQREEAARKELEEVEGARQRLQGALQEREAEVTGLREALDAMRRESQDQEAALRERLQEAQAAGARQTGELEELQERLRRAQEEAGSETGRLDSLVGGLKAEVDTLRTAGETLQGENAELKGERAELQAEREALGARLEEALRLKEAEASRLEAAVEEARHAAEERRAEADRHADEVEAARQLAKELGLRAQQLERERALASSQCEALRGEEAALREQLEKMESDKGWHAKNQHSTAQREVELLREQLLRQTQEAFQQRRKSEQDMQQLLEAKMADAINQRVELHICVPKTSVTYNNAPPLVANVADGLGDQRIEEFLDREVFPHFEPLWARVDDMAVGPDGTCKETYSKKMLGKLTEAVRAYIRRAQDSNAVAT